MKRFSILLIILSSLLSCQRDYNKIKSPNKLLPSASNSVIVINELNDFIRGVENHNILSGIYNKELKTTSKVLENLNTTNPIYVAFLNENNTDYLIVTENDSTLFVIDSISNHISESLTDFKINKTQIDSLTFYNKVYGNVFTVSNNLELLKNLNTETENTTLNDLLKTTDSKSIASLIFKTDSKNYSKLLFSESDGLSDNFTILDVNYSDKTLQYNGLVKSGDSVISKIDCFKNTVPQQNSSVSIAPPNTSSLLSISYDDFSVFNKNLHQLKGQENDSTQTFLNFTNEIALIDNAIIIHSLDTDLVLETIEEKSIDETFRDIDIYEYGNTSFFQNRLQPFFNYENARFFTKLKEFIIFSSSKDVIKSIISSALNNNTLVNTDAYKNISDNLSNEASLFVFKDSNSLSKVMGNSFNDYRANAVQFIYEDNYAHVNGIIQEFKKRAATNSVTEAYTTSIDAMLLSAPQTVKNHITGAHDIVVQDVNNVLYLISSSGNILWKKQLQGEILGNIEQIDMYKNGRLQLAFATSNYVYVLDRNGKDVAPFPRKFNDKITQPLSVFDYDKRKNYRLLVTQGKNLLMYDVKGKSVSGFNYKNNGSNITTQPKHFRIGSKDYIAFATEDHLKILNRQGSVRIPIEDKIRFSENELYLYQNKFTSTNTLGELVQADTKGRLSTKNLNLTDKHKIETTSKTLVSMTDNRLNIKSRSIDLDFGDYTEPRIFYLNDKIYITTTDLQSKKVYLFDSQAKSIPNFPVFGASAAELQKLDKDNGLELITKADNKTIVVYKLY